MNTIVTGRLGYNLVERRLLENGFDLYIPLLENTPIDCIVIKNGKLNKIQIKTIQLCRGYKVLPVRKLSNNRGINKQKHYTSKDVDFFLGVDLDTNLIYVVPMAAIEKYTSAISINNLSNYKENYALMEHLDRDV